MVKIFQSEILKQHSRVNKLQQSILQLEAE